jgi:ornithine decarboxylase
MVEHNGGMAKWEDVPTDALASEPGYWQLTPESAWHGYHHVVPSYAMTDPNKLTLLTPGFDRLTGNYSEYGLPAPILAQ